MIKVTSIKLNGDNTAEISAFADSKAEVTGGAEFVGLPDGYTPAMSSVIITATGDIGFYTSTGIWSWI